MLTACLVFFTGCDKPKVEEEAWKAALDISKWNNLTVTVTEKTVKEDGSAVNKESVSTLKIEATKAYQSYAEGEEFEEGYYDKKDDQWVMVYNAGTKDTPRWVGYVSEYVSDPHKSIEEFAAASGLNFSDAQYDKKAKCYVLHNVKLSDDEEAVETVNLFFEDGTLVKMEVFNKLKDNATVGAKTRDTMVIVFSDRGTTTVTVPAYTMIN